MKEYLKIKVMSLIAERRIIKTQAERTAERLRKRLDKIAASDNATHRAEMGNHNARDYKAGLGMEQHERELAIESRLSGLAYGFIRGRVYPQMEAKLRYNGPYTKVLTEDQLARILVMVTKYDERDKRDMAQHWERFIQDAKNVPIARPAHGSRQARIAARRPGRSRADWENAKAPSGNSVM